MIEKQDLVKDLLLKKLSETKVGILAKGFGEIDPATVARELSAARKSHIYMAAVGYGISEEIET